MHLTAAKVQACNLNFGKLCAGSGDSSEAVDPGPSASLSRSSSLSHSFVVVAEPTREAPILTVHYSDDGMISLAARALCFSQDLLAFALALTPDAVALISYTLCICVALQPSGTTS